MSRSNRLALLALLVAAAVGLLPAAAQRRLSVHDLAQHGSAGDRDAVGQLGGGAGREVPQRHGGLHQGRALLQGQPEHRDARRQPVDHLGHPPGDGDLRQRDGDRLARGDVLGAGRDLGQHDLRGLLPHRRRLLLGRQRLLRHRRRRRAAAARAGRRGRRWQRRLPLRHRRLPVVHLRLDQLLGRRRLRHHVGRRHPAHGDRPDARSRSDRRGRL